MCSSDDDILMMRRFIRKKRRERVARRENLLQTARRDFTRITEMIIHEFSPQRVHQWGSLVTGEHFQEISDIDIGLEGITDPAEYFSLCSRVEAMTEFPLHIV
jgi:predicted nucleotidyltransferase